MVLKTLARPKDFEIYGSHADVEVEGEFSEYETSHEDPQKEYLMIRDILHERGISKDARVSDEKWVANQFDKDQCRVDKSKGPWMIVDL